MKTKILTYQDCLSIINNTDETLFFKKEFDFNGFKVVFFNYRYANYSDFIKWGAEEMRGLTFIFNEDGSLFKRYLMLHKFWNLNQVEEAFYKNVKDLKIISVMDKEDGSLISFNKFPDGKVYARSKMSYTSDHALLSQQIYENDKHINKLVNDCLDNNIVLFFEFVSDEYKIVLSYKENDLILLRARDNDTGEYIDIRTLDIDNIKTPKFNDYTIDEIIELSTTKSDHEGWVIETDSMMYKLKTKWYFDRHFIYTESLNRVNHIIKYILNSEIDDILAQLSDNKADDTTREEVNRIELIVSKGIIKYGKDYDELMDIYNKSLDRKTFYKENKDHYLMKMITQRINNPDKNNKQDQIVERILKETYKQKSAEKWLSKYNEI